MVYIVFTKITEEEAMRVTGRKFIEFPDDEFLYKSRGIDLNKDKYFERYLRHLTTKSCAKWQNFCVEKMPMPMLV